MSRPMRVLAVLALAALPASAAPTSLNSDWPFDVLKLKNGVIHKGLLLEESPSGVRFQIVGRAPGRPTVKLTLMFAKAEVARLDKLSDEDRAALKAKLDEVDLSPEAEARRLEKLDLKAVDWQGKKDAGLRYDSDYFTLVSDAPVRQGGRAGLGCPDRDHPGAALGLGPGCDAARGTARQSLGSRPGFSL